MTCFYFSKRIQKVLAYKYYKCVIIKQLVIKNVLLYQANNFLQPIYHLNATLIYTHMDNFTIQSRPTDFAAVSPRLLVVQAFIKPGNPGFPCSCQSKSSGSAPKCQKLFTRTQTDSARLTLPRASKKAVSLASERRATRGRRAARGGLICARGSFYARVKAHFQLVSSLFYALEY